MAREAKVRFGLGRVKTTDGQNMRGTGRLVLSMSLHIPIDILPV